MTKRQATSCRSEPRRAVLVVVGVVLVGVGVVLVEVGVVLDVTGAILVVVGVALAVVGVVLVVQGRGRIRPRVWNVMRRQRRGRVPSEIQVTHRQSRTLQANQCSLCDF